MEGAREFDYNVVIAGGGLAGLGLALQLKRTTPDMRLLVAEFRHGAAPVAVHKVGESLSEMGSHYFRNVVGLSRHLEEQHIRKLGFRFFFPSEDSDFAGRVEIGSRLENPVPTHQVDRGPLENEMMAMARELGIHVVQGARVQQIEVNNGGHRVEYTHDDRTESVLSRWVVDASGRAGLLKRQLHLQKDFEHNINAVWFRVPAEIDIDTFSEDPEYRTAFGTGRRRMATNHLMGKGYWVWIIPLSSGNTSVGIVSDPRFHPLTEVNTYEKSMAWLNLHEPCLAAAIHKVGSDPLDFRVLKNFSYNSAGFFSADRWAVTGEAGAFLDPFYSPGSDMIGLSNSFIADLILRDYRGEDIRMRTMAYEIAQSEMVKEWISLYQDQYEIFGNTQVMLQKILWDWATYWALPSMLFYNHGYTDLETLKDYASDSGRKFTQLNRGMQRLFRNWAAKSDPALSRHRFNTFDVSFLKQFHLDLKERYPQDEVRRKLKANIAVLEQVAAGMTGLVAHDLYGTDPGLAYDPYDIPEELTLENLANCARSEKAILPEPGIVNDLSHVYQRVNKEVAV